jgi:omega-6 fatty acid desaturase (delta-12 desaturase)
MYWSLRLSYWVTLALAIPTGALLVRVFIIQHDCGHGSFFVSKRANNLMGMFCSMLTLTPYANWRRQHAGHHANWNNLDKRYSGWDIYSTCMTVNEYRALKGWKRLAYRASRHPLVAHVLVPPFVFLLLYRVPFDTPKSWTARTALST